MLNTGLDIDKTNDKINVNPPMKRAAVYLLCAIGFFISISNEARAESINDLSLGDVKTAFSDGGEYPGATGSAKIEGQGNSDILELKYDFTGGGSYVAVGISGFPPITQATEIQCELKISTPHKLFLRIVDSSGETHHLPATGVEEASDGWLVVIFDLSAKAEAIYGGDDNKGIDFPIESFWIGINKGTELDSGVAEFRNFKAVN